MSGLRTTSRWVPTSLLIAGFLLPAAATAGSPICTLSMPSNLQVFGRYEFHPGRGIITPDGGSQESPITISGCPDAKFLMVAVSPKEFRIDAGQFDVEFNGRLDDDRCRLRNNPFPLSFDFQSRRASFSEKTRFIRECVEIEAGEANTTRLNFPETQPGCEITRLDERRALLKGGFCFLTPNSESRILFQLRIKQQCLDKNYLAERQIAPQTVHSALVFAMTGDATGDSTDLTYIGDDWHNVDFSLNPGSNLMPLSEDQGDSLPRWPGAWAADLSFGDFSLYQGSGDSSQTRLILPLLASNLGARKCDKNLCSGTSDYPVPIAAEVKFYQVLPNGKREELDSWFTGGVAYPHWQGILDTRESKERYIDGSLELGGEYEIEALFGNPFEDYELLTQKFPTPKLDLRSITDGTPGGSVINPIDPIIGFSPMKSLPGLPGMGGDLDPGKIIDGAIGKLPKILYWPVFTPRICDESSGKCRSVSASRFHTRLTARFKIRDLVPGDMGLKYRYGPVTLKRTSTVLPEYERIQQENPRVECGVF